MLEKRSAVPWERRWRLPSLHWASQQTWPTAGPAEIRSPALSAAGPTVGGHFPALASVHADLQARRFTH